MKSPKTVFKANYRWVIVALCFLMIFLGLGFCSSNRSIFLSPITEALGIKRSAFSLADSIRFIISATVNLFYGSFISRFGTKKLICGGFISLIIANFIYSFAETLPLFYLAGVFYGIGFSFTTTSMVGCVLIRWCHNNVGVITGIVLAANGIGSAIATQWYTPFIYESGNPFGYKKAFLTSIILLIIVLVLFLIFYKEHPPAAETKNNTTNKPKNKKVWDGIDFKAAIKLPCFWITIICISLSGLVLQSVWSTAAAHMKDVGLSVTLVATIISVNSLILSFSKILCGMIYDRFGLRVTITYCFISSLIALSCLTLLSNHPMGTALALTYAIFSSLALPMETVMIPLYASELFGMKSYHQILGVFSAATTVGYAVGTPLTNLFYDRFGTYSPVFLAFCFVMLAIFIALQFIIHKSNSLKKG